MLQKLQLDAMVYLWEMCYDVLLAWGVTDLVARITHR